jgi:branched-subunit amino acid ABC-type transport system permease component
MFGFFASVGYLKLCQGLITVATGGGIGVLTIGGYGLASLGGVLAAPEWTGIAVVTMTAALVANAWFLRHSLTGIAAIALGDDPALSLLFGIRPVLVRIVVYSVGGATAGLGGLFLAADSGLRPDVGFSVCLKAFAVLIVSGGRVPLVCLWSAVLVAVEIAAGYWWGGHAREATGLVFLGVVLLAARVYASAWRAKSEG